MRLNAVVMNAHMTAHILWCCKCQVNQADDVLQSVTISAVVCAARCIALFSTSSAMHISNTAPDTGHRLSDSPKLTCTFAQMHVAAYC